MEPSEVVQQFIAKYITSVDQLEILLLLKQHPGREWTAEEVARTLSTETTGVQSRLGELAGNGLISEKKLADRGSYQYGPRTIELQRAIDELAAEYPRFRVRIINLIFSKPIDNIRTFADAFRLKKDEEEDK